MSKMSTYVFLSLFGAVACHRTEGTDTTAPEKSSDGTAAKKAPAAASKANAAPGEKGSRGPVAVGETAPSFTLRDLQGNLVSLDEHRGKIVVLEWFNPDCPFVRAAHTKGSLVKTAESLMGSGVVYLAINSAAPGKQGYGKDANLKGKERFHLPHAILMDEDGSVGRKFGATNTPHIFVIRPDGRLAYAGAVDNSPDGEGESPKGGELVNFLTQVVDELQQGKEVSVPQTRAYGCSVKYSD